MEMNVHTMSTLLLSLLVLLLHGSQSFVHGDWNMKSSSLTSSGSSSLRESNKALNFLSVSRSTGELVIAVRLDGVFSVKRVVGNELGVQMIILQATDGNHLVYNIFDPEYRLKECKATKHQAEVDDFVKGFHATYGFGLEVGNHNHKQRPLNPLSATPVNLDYIYNVSESQEVFVLPRSSIQGVKLHPTIRMMIDVIDARRVCREMETNWKAHMMLAMDGQTRDGHATLEDIQDIHNVNDEEAVEQDDDHGRSSREKRSIFIVPGTLWCGAGNVAKSYDDLGEHNTTDVCCREHDHCPETIVSWGSKFKIFNHRLYTISSCDCDRRFRDCLLNVNTSVSRAVGDAFFNLLGCACFQIEEEERCVSRSWWPWNACSRYQQIRRAIINFIGPVIAFIHK